MIFNTIITIPHNTEKTDALKQDIELCYGIIREVNIYFPAGCHGLVYVKLKQGLHSVLPLGHPNYFAGNDINIKLNVGIDMTDYPYLLQFEGYNVDDTYDHTIHLLINIQVPEITHKLTDFEDLEDI